MAKPTANQIIALAKQQVGVTEKNSNDVKYNTWYYGHAVNDASKGGCVYPWCMAFQSWLFKEKGALDLIGGKSASCANTRNWFKSKGQWHSTPKVGDLVFFSFSHVGLVIEVHDGYIVTIEGNTSSNDSGSQRNGGMVAKRTRKSSILGYGRPDYAKPVSNTVKIKKKCQLYKAAMRVKGSFGALVVGKEVTFVKDYGHGWSKAKATINGTTHTGYVKNSCINKSGLSKYRTGIITDTTAIVRKQNKKGSKQITTVTKGMKVTVISVGKFWVNVKVKKGEKTYDGFIFHTRLKVQ